MILNSKIFTEYLTEKTLFMNEIFLEQREIERVYGLNIDGSNWTDTYTIIFFVVNTFMKH